MSTQVKRQSAMFRSIVMMGSGLALSCGGVAQEAPHSNPADGGSGSAGKPSTSTAGSASLGVGGTTGASGSGSAGGLSVGLSGATSVGVAGAGGTSNAAGASGSGSGSGGAPLDCPTTQWTCAGPDSCEYETGWTPVNCKCDPNRPRSPLNCAPGQTFTCLGARFASGAWYGFECSCVPSSSTSGCTCDDAFGTSQGHVQCADEAIPQITLCGCAVVLLK